MYIKSKEHFKKKKKLRLRHHCEHYQWEQLFDYKFINRRLMSREQSYCTYIDTLVSIYHTTIIYHCEFVIKFKLQTHALHT